MAILEVAEHPFPGEQRRLGRHEEHRAALHALEGNQLGVVLEIGKQIVHRIVEAATAQPGAAAQELRKALEIKPDYAEVKARLESLSPSPSR